jgi:lipopolysaccharide export system ATP-binding protein
MSMLRVSQLSKRYRRRQVVQDVSLKVDAGEVVGLLGPNGAGKTTCFYMIVGLIAPDQGEIELDGKRITRLPMHRRARIGLGYLPQEASVFRGLGVAQNLLAVLELQTRLGRAQRQEECERLLHEFGLGHLRDQEAISLSGGERRRLEIARALASRPRVLLLDEPFAGIDPISVHDIQQIVAQLAEQGIGVLITDHNVRETLGICSHSYILAEGRLLAQGSAAELTENRAVRESYLGESFRL